MRLLDRYLFRELLTPLLYCLAGFFMFWIGADMFKEQSFLQPLKAVEILAYYVVAAPSQIVEILPIALLLALLYALSNHARHFEITAIRAAGVSIWRLALPYFIVGFTATVLVFVLNEYFVIPDRDARLEEVKRWRAHTSRSDASRGLLRDFGFHNEREGRKWLVGLYDTKTAQMWNAQVISSLPLSNQNWLKASNAVYAGPGWIFYNAVEYRPQSATNPIPVPVLQTNVLARPDFTETPDEIRSEVKIAARLNSGGREADLPLREIVDYLHFHPQLRAGDERWLFTYLHGRLATPWRCLVVVLIALPFGAASGRRNVFVGVASSIFIAFAYFVLARVSLALGTGGHLPPWLAGWAPNIIFGGAGLWLTARMR